MSIKIIYLSIASGASSGTQLDEANQHRRPPPRNRNSGQQLDIALQPANLNTMRTYVLPGSHCHLLEILTCQLWKT